MEDGLADRESLRLGTVLELVNGKEIVALRAT
jgi:hypothetical protein